MIKLSAVLFIALSNPPAGAEFSTGDHLDLDVLKQLPAAEALRIQSKLDEVKVARADYESKVQEANTRIQTTDRQLKRADHELDQIKASKLLGRYGVTAGVAVAVQFPSVAMVGDAEQLTVAPTFLPYVMFVPAYWAYSEAQATICASHWGAASPQSASKVARFTVRRDAEARYATIAEKMSMQADVSKDASSEVLDLIKGGLSNPSEEADEKERAVTLLEERLESGSCGWSKVGFWVGIPSNYSATTSLHELPGATLATRSRRSIDSAVAFGLSFTPNSYVSLLFGYTIGSLAQQPVAASDTRLAAAGSDYSVGAFTLAFGANLDIIGALLKTGY